LQRFKHLVLGEFAVSVLVKRFERDFELFHVVGDGDLHVVVGEEGVGVWKERERERERRAIEGRERVCVCVWREREARETCY
jgi:hypothetical protein